MGTTFGTHTCEKDKYFSIFFGISEHDNQYPCLMTNRMLLLLLLFLKISWKKKKEKKTTTTTRPKREKLTKGYESFWKKLYLYLYFDIIYRYICLAPSCLPFSTQRESYIVLLSKSHLWKPKKDLRFRDAWWEGTLGPRAAWSLHEVEEKDKSSTAIAEQKLHCFSGVLFSRPKERERKRAAEGKLQCEWVEWRT